MGCRSLRRFSKLSLVLLFGLLLATGGMGCDSAVKSGFSSVSTGMTQDEVRGLLGDPSVVIPGETGEGGAILTGPRWQYGDNLSTITTAAAFPQTVPDRVWVVWFDADGLVRRTRRPVAVLEVGESDAAAPDTPLFPPVMPPRNR